MSRAANRSRNIKKGTVHGEVLEYLYVEPCENFVGFTLWSCVFDTLWALTTDQPFDCRYRP